MLVKYYQYNHPEPALEHFIYRLNEMNYNCYASRLLNNLLLSSDFDMEESVKKVIAIFRLTGIPVQEHIQGIYCSDLNGTRKDWHLSELACSLVILTSEVANAKVRETKDDLLSFIGL